MRQTPTTTPVGITGWLSRAAIVALGVLAAVYVVSTIPGVRSTPGFDPRIDGWFQGTVFVLTAVVAALRPLVSSVERLVWSLVAVALACRAFGYLYYFAEIRTQVPQPYPSLADAGWIAGSAALIATLVVLIRPWARRFSLLLALDALIAAVTAGAVATALLWDTLIARQAPGASTSVVTVNLAYPLLDVALLVLCAGYLTLVRWRPTYGFLCLLVGIIGFAIIDAVFLYQVTAGTFRPASFLSALNMVATVAIAYAGWVNLRTGDGPEPEPDTTSVTRTGGFWLGPRGVLVPVACAIVCFAVEGYVDAQGQPLTSAALPLTGLLLVLVRGVITLFSERGAAEEEMLLKNDELLRFQSLVEASGDFIAIAGIDGSVIYLNPAGRELVGFDADLDVTKTSITDYLTEEGIKASIEVEQPAVVAAGHWEGESTLRNHRGGLPIPVAISSFVMQHPVTGEPMALATVQRDITERLIAQSALQDLADQRQDLLDRLVQAQEDERGRIAADVHDDSVQALAAVELRLGLLRRRLAGRAPDLVQTVDQLAETVDTATGRLRHLLFDLDSPALRDDLAGALEQAASYVFEDRPPAWSIAGDRSIDLPEGLRVTAYRIAKEAMVNVHKHAGATKVTIGLDRLDGGVEVRITDDGRGVGPDEIRDQPGHLGVTGMRDRAAVAGGWVRVESPPEGGTVVRLWLPDPASD